MMTLCRVLLCVNEIRDFPCDMLLKHVTGSIPEEREDVCHSDDEDTVRCYGDVKEESVLSCDVDDAVAGHGEREVARGEESGATSEEPGQSD